MKSDALLGLISDLYSQLGEANKQVAQLEKQNKDLETQVRKVLEAARARQAELQAQQNQPEEPPGDLPPAPAPEGDPAHAH